MSSNSMSVVVVAGPMVTKCHPNRVRVSSSSSDDTSSKLNTGKNPAIIPASTNKNFILSSASRFASISVPRYPEGGLSPSIGQADTDQGKIPLSFRHQQYISDSTQNHTQPSARHSYSKALPTSSFPFYATLSAVEAHKDSNEEEEDTSGYEDIESDDAEGQIEESDQTGKRGKAAKGRSKRFRLTQHQTRFLMGEFARQTHPNSARRISLSKEIPGLSPRQVQVWFQNKRAKFKRLTPEDREQMIKSRVPPEMNHTLRSPSGSNVAAGGSLIPIPAQRPQLVYDQYQQDHPRSDQLGTRSASFSSGIPNLTPPCGTSLNLSAHSEENAVPAANPNSSFLPRGQRANTFTTLTPETIACLNSPLRFSDPAATHYDFRSNPDQHIDFIPSLNLFAQLSPLPVEAQPQINETTGLVNHQQNPDYEGIIQNVGATYSQYVQSPTAYLPPISTMAQDFSLPKAGDFFPLPPYQSDANKEIRSYDMNMTQAPSLTVVSQGYEKSATGQSSNTSMPRSVYDPGNHHSRL